MTGFNPSILYLYCANKSDISLPVETVKSIVYKALNTRVSITAVLQELQPSVIILDMAHCDCHIASLVRDIHAFDVAIPLIILYHSVAPDTVFDASHSDYIDTIYIPALLPNQLAHCIERALKAQALHHQNTYYQTALEKANTELKEYIRLLERDQKAGKQIQAKLLPQAPIQYNHYHVDHKVIPSLYLSGDFIDYGFLNDRFVAFYLCDVSGHGAASAFVTVWLKQRVRRYFYKEAYFLNDANFEKDVVDLLNRLNTEFLNTGLGSHITGFMGVIDTHTGKMHYIVAGHLPLPILVIDGHAQYLEGKGKPVGIFEQPNWQVYHILLPVKQPFSLIAFSDGVLEILPPENLIEKEQYLLELMSSLPSTISDITQLLRLESITSLPDDIAILKMDNEITL